jgi:hypothetical protein
MSSEKSRFDGLFSVARSKAETDAFAQTSKPTRHLDVQTSKSSNPDYQRTTLYIPKSLHKQFKAAAVTDEKDMSDIMTELIQDWIKSRNNVRGRSC